MDQWKKLICRGNRCFELARLGEAGTIYEAALAEADLCIDSQAAEASCCRYLDAVAAVAAYVVTRHNLADLCLRLDRPEEAAAHLLAAHARIAGIIDDGSLPWSLRAAAIRNRNRAREALAEFADQHEIAGSTYAMERRITHMPPSPVLH
jgi:hypothetical protein